MKEIISPLTGRKSVEKIASYEARSICRDWMNQFGMDVSSEFHCHKHLDVYRCRDTGIVFFDPPDVIGSGAFYAELQKFDWYYMKDKWEHQVAIKDLESCKHVLEIGAATGNFVKSCKDLGIDIAGIEMNEDAVAVAQANGLPVSLTKLDEVQSQSVDGVCSFQVLEHISEPVPFIASCLRVLKPGGILIFSVPNLDSFMKHAYILLDMPPHHQTRWGVRAFKALESMYPLRLEAIHKEPLAAYHAGWYLGVWTQYFRENKPCGFLLFNRLTMPLYRLLLGFGFCRRLITGHTLYVKFRKC